jgi:hypothetical protein
MFNGCGKGDIPWNWKPSLFMPKEAARLFLKVKSVRIEKLHEITEEDAEAEGIDNQLWYVDSDGDEINLAPYSGKVPSPNFKTGFADLWDRINKKRGYGWSENPYVYIYEFMRLDAGKE